MERSRPPAVAGMFYPDQAPILRAEVLDLLSQASSSPQASEDGYGTGTAECPKALIAPHAGYIYSGPVAASAYARITPHAEAIRRVVLLGPAHRYPLRGLAASRASAFETPLGSVRVDEVALQEVLALKHVNLLDEAYEGEHSLEVHLPFLQVVLPDFKLVPLVVGDASPEDIAQVLKILWGGPETLIVVSSDLSHFLSYSEASELDASTARAVQDLQPHQIGYEQACGRLPMAGLILRALEEGLSVECVDLRNSGDTAGPRDRVVGYGSFLFS